MSDRYDDNTASGLRSEGQGPTQGQSQGQYDDPSSRVSYASEVPGPAQGQGQAQGQSYDDPAARPSRFGSRGGSDPFQDTSQSADPDFSRDDQGRGQSNEQTRRHSAGGGQDYGQQGQWRQGGQTAGDNFPDRGEPVAVYGVGQVSGGPQEGFDSSKNYGASTGTGPGARSDYPDIPRDGGFGGKPTPPERLMGTAEKLVGKATGNVRMYEHGQERKAGGY